MDVRRILAGFSAVPVLLLTACGGSSSSIADPPVSSGPTSSGSTRGPSVPIWTFVASWVREDSRMQNSGRTGRFRSLGRGCQGCDAVADKMDEIYGAGGFVKTQGLRVLAHHESARKGNLHTIELSVNAAPTVYRLRRGGPLMHFKGGPDHFQLAVLQVGDSWVVTRFVQVAS